MFPIRGLLRIVAVGLSGDTGQLISLHRAIEQRVQFLGYAREDRPFRPHVTFARARSDPGADVRSRLASELSAHLPGPSFVANEFVLMRSHLKATGAEYEPLFRFR